MNLIIVEDLLVATSRAGLNSSHFANPGVDLATIEDLQVTNNIIIHDDIRMCYVLSNGVTIDDDYLSKGYYHYFRWLPLQEALYEYTYFNVNHEYFLDEGKEYFPMFRGTRDYIVVSNDVSLPSEVFAYDAEFGLSKMYLNLETMFATHLRCWREGIFTVVDGVMQVSDREKEVSREMNPDADFWY